MRPCRRRNTRQREAIRQAFTGHADPLDVQQVLRAARRRVPGLGVATVYRTLGLLCEQGWLVRIELPGRRTFYERAGKPHHHHFLCRACERLYRIEGCVGEVEALAPDGSVVEAHDLLLRGTCRRCRRAS